MTRTLIPSFTVRCSNYCGIRLCRIFFLLALVLFVLIGGLLPVQTRHLISASLVMALCLLGGAPLFRVGLIKGRGGWLAIAVLAVVCPEVMGDLDLATNIGTELLADLDSAGGFVAKRDVLLGKRTEINALIHKGLVPFWYLAVHHGVSCTTLAQLDYYIELFRFFHSSVLMNRAGAEALSQHGATVLQCCVDGKDPVSAQRAVCDLAEHYSRFFINAGTEYPIPRHPVSGAKLRRETTYTWQTAQEQQLQLCIKGVMEGNNNRQALCRNYFYLVVTGKFV